MERYSQRSRLTRREEKTAYRKIFIAVISIIILFFLMVYLGIPSLINMALFISNLKGEGDLENNSQTTSYLAPPTLESPFEATNTAKIKIKGYSIANYRVELFLNGDSYKKFLVPKDGNFSVDNIFLQKGENKVWAITENSLGKRSERSLVLMILYKNEPPKIEITSPLDNSIISNDSKEVTVSGMTEGASNLSINDRLVILDTEGKFSYEYPLKDDENTLVIIASDIAGNTVRVERKVTYKAP